MEPDLVSRLESLHHDAFGWACHCCGGNSADPADVLQISYLKVIEGRAFPRDRSSLKTWWFGVIRLTAMEERRRRRIRESHTGRWLFFASPRESAPVPSAKIELDEVSIGLKKALAQLPARQAEVLHLVFYQDLSLSEAARIMRVSVGSARSHYERAKSRLRSLLSRSPE